MKNSLIEISIGDLVQEKHDNNNGRIGILKDIKLVPNGVNNPNLIAMLYVLFPNDVFSCQTANNFVPCEGEMYKEFYPSAHFSKLKI